MSGADTQALHCRCGKVHIVVSGAPIIRAECHCNSCRTAGARIEALPGATAFREDNGATRFVMYRKDRVRIESGQDLLVAYHLGGSSTRRVVASCCNMPVFLEFKGGHWLSLYGTLWPAGMARPDIATVVGDAPAGTVLDDSVPSGGLVTAGFFARLLGAWVAMGFKVPKIDLEGREVRL